MKEDLELGKGGKLTLPPSICRAAKIQDGHLLKAVIDKDGSVRLTRLAAEKRERVEQS
jgi:hypothetical protein